MQRNNSKGIKYYKSEMVSLHIGSSLCSYVGNVLSGHYGDSGIFGCDGTAGFEMDYINTAVSGFDCISLCKSQL